MDLKSETLGLSITTSHSPESTLNAEYSGYPSLAISGSGISRTSNLQKKRAHEFVSLLVLEELVGRPGERADDAAEEGCQRELFGLMPLGPFSERVGESV